MEEACNIISLIRCRPLSATENKQGAGKVIKMHNEKTIIHNPHGSGNDSKEQTFTFDFSFQTDTKTEAVVKDALEPLVTKVLNGKNLSIVAYGQDGTGKSHTLSGTEDEAGVVPLLSQSLFKGLDESGKRYLTTVSFLEVKSEELYDLLNPHTNEIKIRQHPNLGLYIDGLSEIVVRSSEDCSRLFEQGNRVKKIYKDQKSNNLTKRSDAVFTINIEWREQSNNHGLRAKIIIASVTAADLKKDNQSPAYELYNKGVNTLYKVVNGLIDMKKRSVIPYRESKLTRVLQDAFGGNSYTVFVGTVSPADASYQETLHTLEFAQSIRNIKNAVKQNEDDNVRLIKELRDEINRLREKLARASTNPETAVQNKEDIQKFEEMIKDLNIAKKQTWFEKERLSDMYEEERRANLSEKGMIEWVFDVYKKDSREVKEKLLALQQEKDILSTEYKEKRRIVDEMKDDLQSRISEYSKLGENNKRSDEETKQYVNSINDVKEKLKFENEGLKEIKKKLRDNQDKIKQGKADAKLQNGVSRGNLEIQQLLEAEERKKREKDNESAIDEELDRMKVEIQQEKAEVQLKMAEGIEYTPQQILKLENELIELRAERSILTLKISTLQQEKTKLLEDLNDVYKRHKEAFEIQKLQQFQTFRNYRDMFEQEKVAMDQRYRTLLEEAIQDAIYLSSRNTELVQENEKLKEETAKSNGNSGK